MHTQALVSILIPTYNQDAYISTTIESALAQDYPNLEVVVTDDRSTDATETIVASFDDPRLRYEPSVKNLGRAANYRRGLYELARGEWVLNLDGDDFLVDRTFIGAAVRAADGDDAPVLVFADRYERENPIDPTTFPSGAATLAEPEYLDGTAYVLSLPRPRARMHHLCALYNAAEARAIGFYRSDIISSDYESLFRLALGRRIAHLPSRVAVWRRHPNNASGSRSRNQTISNYGLFPAVRDFAVARLGPSVAPAFDDWLTRNVANRYYGNILGCLRDWDLAELRELDRFIKAKWPSARRKTFLNPKLVIKAFFAGIGGARKMANRRAT